MDSIKSFNLRNVHDLHLIFSGYRCHEGLGHWYRGQADSTWGLIPKGGREPYRLPENRDLGRFNAWCMQAIAYSSLPKNSIERLALAQHHGLATRLLDWSQNPLVACFFACFELPENDGAVYIIEAPEELVKENTNIEQIKLHRGVYGYIPNRIAPRILNQKGMFTVHCDATHPIEVKHSRIDKDEKSLVKVIIPASLKPEVMKVLGDYGIDRAFLFPDLDGLSEHINNRTKEIT